MNFLVNGCDLFKHYKDKAPINTQTTRGGYPIDKHTQIPIALLIMMLIVLPAFNMAGAQTQPSQTTQNSWTTLASMPTPREGLGIAVVNGRIYAIGGLSDNTLLNVNEEYTPSLNQWTTKSPMPTARTGFAVAVYDSKIYCIGGTIGGAGSNEFVGNNEVYDPVSDTWQTAASMPTPRADLSASVVNGKIYLIGGMAYSSKSPFYVETNITEVYDPTTNSWSAAASMPIAVYGYSSGVINDEIYVIGGSTSGAATGTGGFVNSNQIYDTKSNSWRLSTNLPSGETFAGAAVTSGFMAPPLLYLVGGLNSGSYMNTLQFYDEGNNSWRSGAPMPTARAYLGVAEVNDVLYAIGGFDGTNWLNTVEQYTPEGYGTVPPLIQITSPGNDTYSKIILGYTSNRDTSWVGYSLDDKKNVTVNGEVELTNLTQGTHSIILYGNDSSGNMGSSNKVFFSVNSLPPEIDVVTPQNQTYGSTDIQLTFILDQNATKLSYSLDGGANQTIEGNVTLPALSNGSHSVTIYVTGIYGLSNSETVYFNVAPFPTLTFVGVAASVVIVVASGYLLLPKKKPVKSIKRKLPV